MTECELIN